MKLFVTITLNSDENNAVADADEIFEVEDFTEAGAVQFIHHAIMEAKSKLDIPAFVAEITKK